MGELQTAPFQFTFNGSCAMPGVAIATQWARGRRGKQGGMGISDLEM